MCHQMAMQRETAQKRQELEKRQRIDDEHRVVSLDCINRLGLLFKKKIKSFVLSLNILKSLTRLIKCPMYCVTCTVLLELILTNF